MSNLNLALLLIGQLAEASNKARHIVKGTRASYVLPILIIGMAGDIRLKEAVLATGLKADNLSHRFKRLGHQGYLMRYQRGRYTLTDKGLSLYSALNKNLKPAIDKLVYGLIKQVHDSKLYV